MPLFQDPPFGRGSPSSSSPIPSHSTPLHSLTYSFMVTRGLSRVVVVVTLSAHVSTTSSTCRAMGRRKLVKSGYRHRGHTCGGQTPPLPLPLITTNRGRIWTDALISWTSFGSMLFPPEGLWMDPVASGRACGP